MVSFLLGMTCLSNRRVYSYGIFLYFADAWWTLM
jgi:hypothetical protein